MQFSFHLLAVKQISSVLGTICIFVSPGLVAIALHLNGNSSTNVRNIFAAREELKTMLGDGVFLEHHSFVVAFNDFFYSFNITTWLSQPA